MKIRLGKSNNGNINISSMWKAFSVWWRKYYNLLFILLMIISMFVGIYFWYISLYTPLMTEEEKNNYRITKDKSIIFLEEDFNHIISDINQRAENYSAKYNPKRDIFK